MAGVPPSVEEEGLHRSERPIATPFVSFALAVGEVGGKKETGSLRYLGMHDKGNSQVRSGAIFPNSKVDLEFMSTWTKSQKGKLFLLCTKCSWLLVRTEPLHFKGRRGGEICADESVHIYQVCKSQDSLHSK